MRRAAAAMLVLGALLACRSKPVKAQVQCQEHTGGFACSIHTIGGTGNDYSVCFDIVATCANGQSLTGSTCQDVSGDGTSSVVVPNAKFTGGSCNVNSVTGVSVKNVKITKK